MNTRGRIALAALVVASGFTAGVVGAAHDYSLSFFGSSQTASLLSTLMHPDTEQLAFGGYTGSNSPSPSSNHQTQSTQQGRGGQAPSGRDPAMGGGTTHSQPSHPTRDAGQGSTPTTNHQTQSQTQGRGGQAPSGRDPAMGGGGTSPGNGASDHGCGGGGCNGNSPTPGSGSTPNGGNGSTPDSRDHQDTEASRAAEQQAKDTREAAAYAQQLGGAGSGDPTADRSPKGIGQKIGSTLSALEQAMSNLMGGPSEPTIPTRGNVTGPDGDVSVYQGTGIDGSYFRDIPSTQPQSPGYSTGAPTDYTKAMNTAATTDTTPHYVTSAATELALNQLKHIDTEMMAQAAKFQQHFANKVSTADSIVSVSEINKTVAGECANGACSDKERVAIANAIMNRVAVAAANKSQLDIHDVLDAFDANMQAENQRKGGVPDNKVYAGADVGTAQYAAGAQALNAVLSGNLPSDMPASVRNATNYHTLKTSPDWAKGVAETPYGPHTFSDANGATADQVQVAKDKVAAGQIRAEISFYKGMNNSASPQSARIQTEVTRSLTVAGRNVNVVTQSTGNPQGPSHYQTPGGTGAPSNKPAGGVAAGGAPPTVSTQKTSLDDPKSSNIPSPADVRTYITNRGWPPEKPIDGQYAYRLSNIIARAEVVTGVTAPANYLSSTYRTPEEQAQIKATFTGKDLTYEGVTYHPDKNNPGYGGNLPEDKQWKAAWPGQSPHQYGQGVDTVSTVTMKDPQARKAADAINNYIQSHTPMHNAVQSAGIDPKTGLPPRSADPSLTGLERVTHDPNHVQISGFKPGAPHTMDKLDASVGADGAAVPGKKTPPGAAPVAGGGLLGGLTRNLPSLTDIKKSLAPSAETQKKLEFVSKLPTWMQNIVISIYTGKSGGAPSSNNESNGGGSAFFPVADRATTTTQRPASQNVDETTLPWWQEYQEKLDALHQTNDQQSI